MDLEYQQTGNQIPIPIDELLNFVVDKLQQYDYLVQATHSNPGQSPYTDPIIYTTQDGKLVQIPNYIQEQAIAQWNDQKYKQININNQESLIQELPVKQERNFRQDMGGRDRIKRAIVVKNGDSKIICIVLLLVITLVVAYSGWNRFQTRPIIMNTKS